MQDIVWCVYMLMVVLHGVRNCMNRADQTVGKLLADIEGEDDGIRSTSLLKGSGDGEAVDLEALVSDVSKEELSLVVNDETFKVKTSVIGLIVVFFSFFRLSNFVV